MKQFFSLLSMVLLLFCFSTSSIGQVSNDNEDEVYKIDQRFNRKAYVPGQVLVKFKASSNVNVRRSAGQFRSSSNGTIDAVLSEFKATEMQKVFPGQTVKQAYRRAKAYNGDMVEEKDLSRIYCVEAPMMRPDSTLLLVKRLQELDEVEYAEPNYKAYIMGELAEGDVICETPGENPLYSQQWGIPYIGVDHLWSKPIVNAQRPIIAILDTGVDVTHPDLVDNILPGWDFVNNTDKMADYNSHGTHVAGIAAAADNGIGIVGANPQALIMPITVMQSDGSGDVRTIAQGIEYAAEHGATVINMSLGTPAYSQVMREALEHAYQTAVLVAAAGNDGMSIYVNAIYPAAHSFVLGVEAIDEDGKRASFSNYDPDGATFSNEKTIGDPEGINYEFKAPGVDILSTIPNGNYRKMNGTSMATPLVSGAISTLQMVKQYNNQELLWGDLLHSNNNIELAFNIAERPADIDVVSLSWKNANGEEVDPSKLNAGETYYLYPIVRTVWGEVNSLKFHLGFGEYEDESTINIVNNDVDFGHHLDAFGKEVSQNPIAFTINPNIADSRHVRLAMTANCEETIAPTTYLFTIVANSMIEIGGVLDSDMTLTSNHTYHVVNSLGIPEGRTLTIEPGTKLEFDKGLYISCNGKLIANGKPGELITFTSHGEEEWRGILTDLLSYEYNEDTGYVFYYMKDTLRYCVLENAEYPLTTPPRYMPYTEDCIFLNTFPSWHFVGIRNNIVCSHLGYGYTKKDLWLWPGAGVQFTKSNYYNNTLAPDAGAFPGWNQLKGVNYVNNFCDGASDSVEGEYIGYSMSAVNNNFEDNPIDLGYIKNNNPSYLGTAKEVIIRPYIYELGNGINSFCKADLSNMLTEPVHDTHGIVWKVVVNGYDAQDEYDQLPPLGVGKHKFEVYFNRPMNKEVTPKVSFGVRSPYTQHAVDKEGSWNEEGTIYTVYATITGKTQSDGVNRVYVYGAEDNEYFECPYENTRFNINIQAAGSLSAGFFGEAGMGRVTLQWDDSDQNSGDLMGYNIFRYQYHSEERMATDDNGSWIWDNETGNWKTEIVQVADTIRLTQSLLDAEAREYIDYDVQPGETYHYYYQVMSTDMSESDRSHTVAVTPLTSILGDANGSGEVDVADVITVVNYASQMDPKPFIYEAADMNVDQRIDILDIIGVIQAILNPNATHEATIESSAVYTIENGVLYVESPVALGGVQVQLTLSEECRVKSVEFAPAEDLKGFECASAWLSDNDYLFLAYSMSGKTLSAGKHSLLYVGDAQVNTLRLGDVNGRNVAAEAGNTTTGVNRMGSDVMNVKGIYDLQGRKLSTLSSQFSTLQKGIYIVNGEKVVK